MGGPGSGGYHGGGRPKEHESIIKTQVNLTPATKAKLIMLAEAMRTNNSAVIRWLIDAASLKK